MDLDTPNSQQKARKFPIPPWLAMIVIGVVVILFWSLVYLWAQGHSPHMGFMEMATIAAQDPHRFLFNSCDYSFLIGVVVAGELLGIVLLVLGFIIFAKKTR